MVKSVGKNFLTVACAAAVMSLGAGSAAQADFVDWYGGGVLTAVSNCPTGNFDQHVNKTFHARFMPPNLGDNGNKSSLSFLNQHWAQGYALTGAFNNTFKTVTAQTIARMPGPAGYPVKVKITKQTPGSVNANTPMITLTGQVSGFSGFPNNDNCTADFTVTVFRP